MGVGSEAIERVPTAADRELGYRLGAVILRCFSFDDGAAMRAIDESGLTFAQIKVLMSVLSDGPEPPTVKDVAKPLGLSLASASRAVDGLVRRDLVLRSEDANDRRMRRLTLTTAGRELADRILAARLEGLGRFAASLSGDERDALEPALDLLLERDELAELYDKYRKGAHR